jgi:hypothetical protein
MNRRGFIKAFMAAMTAASTPQLVQAGLPVNTNRIKAAYEAFTYHRYITSRLWMNAWDKFKLLNIKEKTILLRYMAMSTEHSIERFRQILVQDRRYLNIMIKAMSNDVRMGHTQYKQVLTMEYDEICNTYELRNYK